LHGVASIQACELGTAVHEPKPFFELEKFEEIVKSLGFAVIAESKFRPLSRAGLARARSDKEIETIKIK
jgi:hypothetical protein